MSPTLWAPYGDAVKLILTGSTSETLSSEQKAIYLEMLAYGSKDDAGNKLERRLLPGVKTEKYCVNQEKDEYEDYCFIPDIFWLMMRVFPEWSILAPPIDLDFLNSLRDEAGNSLFMYSNAPGHKQWEDSEEGQRHWNLVCGRLDKLRELGELSRTHHQNDPLKMEAQKRMRIDLENELKELDRALKNFESKEKLEVRNSSNYQSAVKEGRTDFITYANTFMNLFTRLDAKPEELAAWVWLGPENGGIAAYTNTNELEPPRFYYDISQGEDYLAPLASCWFRESDVYTYKPTERFLTGKELVERWDKKLGVITEAVIQANISMSRLTDYHPTFGGTRISNPEDDSFPPLETGLFVLTQIEAIEKEDFETGKIETIQPESGTPEWFKENARKAANARHSKPGGSRDKQQQIRDIWATGKYTTRDICAEQECGALGISFSAARKALRNTPKPQNT